MLSSCHAKVPVLIYIICGQVLFNHRWICTCYTTAGQICVSSQLPARQELLPLQLVNCFFHCSWSSISSITGGQVLLPLQLVNYIFHCSLGTSSIAGDKRLPLQVVSYFFHCSWSTASSIVVSQVPLPLQLVKY